jgi:ERCC4-type nuclease
MISVVIDSREKRPWAFPIELVNSSIGTLPTGDYSLAGDASFAIERKSLDDFLGTIGGGWERFLREIGRMDRFDAKVIIIEGNFEQVCFDYRTDAAPAHNHPRLTPQFVSKRIAELTMMNVSVLFAGNAIYASGLAYAILKERFYELKNREITGKSRAGFVSPRGF